MTSIPGDNLKGFLYFADSSEMQELDLNVRRNQKYIRNEDFFVRRNLISNKICSYLFLSFRTF